MHTNLLTYTCSYIINYIMAGALIKLSGYGEIPRQSKKYFNRQNHKYVRMYEVTRE